MNNPNSAEHRRQIAIRANAALSKDGGNAMQVPLVLDFVKQADISGVIPTTSPYYPPLWQGGAVYVEDVGRIAYCNGSAWFYVQQSTAFLDAWAQIDPSNSPALRKQLGLWTTVQKAAQQQLTNSSVLANDADLLFDVAASKSYAWRCMLSYNTTAAQDFKYQFTGPPSPQLVRYGHSALGVGATAQIVGLSGGAVFSTPLSIDAAQADVVVMIAGLFVNGLTAGTVRLQWAQNLAAPSTTLTVHPGSYLEWREA